MMNKEHEFKNPKEAFQFLELHSDKSKWDKLDLLQQNLKQEPSLQSWNNLVDIINSYPEEAHPALAVWLNHELEMWSDEFRIMPAVWWEKFLKSNSELASIARFHRIVATNSWYEGEVLF